jgi:hypothetical protein
MPNKKIKGGTAESCRRYVPGADAPANVVPGGQTPQGMPNSITAGIPANFSRGGSRSTRRKGRRASRRGRRTSRRGRRASRRSGRRTARKGGRCMTCKGGSGVLATAAVPFGLWGLQRLLGKRYTRKIRSIF